MPGKLKIETNIPEIRRQMTVLRKNISDMSVVMRKASVLFDQWVQLNFRSQGKSVGGWPPFKYGGRVKDGKINTSAKLLQDSGRLRGSFLPFHSKNDAGIGSAIPYSEFHEAGTRHLPVRRMLPVEKEMAEKIGRLFDLHVTGSAKRAGFTDVIGGIGARFKL